MSNELQSALTSMMNTQQALLDRIRRLETEMRTMRGRDWGMPHTYYGVCTPTEPPSTTIRIKSGWIWAYALYNDNIVQAGPRAWPETLVDLTDYASAFATAYYYRWCVVVQNLRNNSWGIWEPADEFEDADVASRHFYSETAICNIDFTDIWANPIAFPHTVLLLRNNGTTGAAGEIEKVTLHDRNYSSFLQQDARPWMNLTVDYVC